MTGARRVRQEGEPRGGGGAQGAGKAAAAEQILARKLAKPGVESRV